MDIEDSTLKQRKEYYDKSFPVETFYKWITRNKKYSDTRELSFTMSDESYIRYQHFKSNEELKRKLKEKVPIKFDIGAVFDKLLIGVTNTPLLREFIIDIDMDEYNDVRYCCQGTNICKKCWTLLVAAVQVLNYILHEQFGFNHILNVFSGRRGIHIWVCDDIAMEMTDTLRMNIVQYLNLFEAKHTNSQNESYIVIPGRHSLFDDSYQILEPLFNKYLQDEQIFECSERRSRFIRLIPTSKQSQCDEKEDLTWDYVKKILSDDPKALQRIVFTYLYPRLDINVSMKRNHLLKAPFCIHPATGNVCVPIPFNKIIDFDVTRVPTLISVQEERENKTEIIQNNRMEEEDSYNNSDNENDQKPKYSYKEFVQFFDSFVNDLIQ
ncbi:DNA primase small subunit, putative [Entamoeba dispar SAW760]|uniref:DNA primase n=1 Tax=Entamoeba dispar (strain ATCC PRA-260 / SAW760) TaxID=370354 RepID=B0E682_ENTDS|nr:DNA primase small subunit, putative [Entamoeba dispar SAW760]EDR29967.1 DNA primase small subunit, putative [Entamoeba dispar SAW760]|eukprot:EDR29967.1 DNA primase small subunit, putative [Entamoeba dispar SAW760]